MSSRFVTRKICAITVYVDEDGTALPWHGATVYQGVDVALTRLMCKQAMRYWLHQSDKRKGRREVNRAYDLLDYATKARMN